MKEIDLEGMSGEDFEIICQEIFSKYYRVNVERTPLVGDGGKDLIIRFSDPVYVECKHHKSTIGRPIVQKLHSAMVTDWVKKGIIVTTGSFSPEAIKHVKDNSLPIELIDGKKLNEIAQSVGIKLFFGYDVKIKELMIPAPSDNTISQEAFNHVNIIKSYPYSIQSSYNYKSSKISFSAFYRVNYSINQDFYNSKKDFLIYSINTKGMLLLDAYNLSPIPKEFSSFYQNIPLVPTSECNNAPHIQSPRIRSDVENTAFDVLISRNSCQIPYMTSNNQHRVKSIVPSKSHIQLSDFSLVYIPDVTVDYSLLGRKLQSNYAFNGDSFIPLDLFSCDICKKKAISDLYLCNSCANIVCSEHHAVCNICGRTLCLNCATPYKAGFLKTRNVCKKCISANPNLKLKKSSSLR